jgi:hypothetical protein
MRCILRNFSTTTKFKTISQKVNIPTPNPKTIQREIETYGRDKVAPKAGEYYPLPVLNSKNIALTQGYYEAFVREPLSSYYVIKIKDVMYHVFNAARIVFLHI